jgi:hypothetical protein
VGTHGSMTILATHEGRQGCSTKSKELLKGAFNLPKAKAFWFTQGPREHVGVRLMPSKPPRRDTVRSSRNPEGRRTEKNFPRVGWDHQPLDTSEPKNPDKWLSNSKQD